MKKRRAQAVGTKDLEQVEALLRSMTGDGRVDEAIELILDLLRSMRDRNTELELRLRQLIRDRFGSRSEKISSDQLDLFMGLLGDKDPQALSTPPEKKKRERRHATPHGRKPLPEDLPREEQVLRVDDDARVCSSCGDEKTCIGYETSEVLEFVPAHFKVIVYKREKLACQNCEDGVVVAPAANKVIEKGLPGPGLLAEVLVNKFKDHLPLYRQQQRFERLGVKLARSSLGGWVADGADLLFPLVERLGELALASYLLQTDDTHLKVLDDSRKPAIKRGALWCYIGDHEHVYFEYTPNRKKEGPQAFLADRVGWLQADGYSGYDALFTAEGSVIIEVGCWMHARRYFMKALDAGDLRAAWPVKMIKVLYDVEREATELEVSHERRLAMRQERSVPVLNELGHWIAEANKTAVPKTPLERALTYAINQWKALNRFTEDGRLPIDNGAVERAIRTVAVGRKNYLFAGSDDGAERAAVLYSLLGSCALAEVNPWAYLQDVLTKLANDWPYARLDELLPAEWKRRQAAAASSNEPPQASTVSD